MLSFMELSREVAAREGLKKPISIAQIKEVLSILSVLMANDPEVIACLLNNGLKKERKSLD